MVGAATELSGRVLNNRRTHRACEDYTALNANTKASATVARYAHYPIAISDDLYRSPGQPGADIRSLVCLANERDFADLLRLPSRVHLIQKVAILTKS